MSKIEKDPDDRHLILRGGVWYYQRKVPKSVWEFDKRKPVFRTSLKTKDLPEARRKRDILEAGDHRRWAVMLTGGDPAKATEAYAAVVRLVEAMGFGFKPSDELANQAPMADLIARVSAMGPISAPEPIHVGAALLGTVAVPQVTVSAANKLYMEEIAAGDLITKDDEQKRKWREIKERGPNLFIELVGDLNMDEITREHALTMRRYWQRKIAPTDGGRPTHTANSGNRSIGVMRTLYSAYYKYIGQDERKNPFAKLNFEESEAGKRVPFPTEFIQEKIMKPGALAALDSEARAILLADIETGCRPGELANLMPTDIVLNHAIPHIIIQPRSDPNDPRELKSKQSKRTIPLVGVALEVFKKYPKGFPRYKGREESLSANVNKFLKNNNLRPKDGNQTLYSLRHSFEDRMKQKGLDVELRMVLMGHKINREEYGNGGGLGYQHTELLKIALPFDPAIVTLDKKAGKQDAA